MLCMGSVHPAATWQYQLITGVFILMYNYIIIAVLRQDAKYTTFILV